MAFGNMMNGMGGIGQQAADLRDSNTPQQLQQGYEKSVKDGTPSLSYLMAISSLAKEVERRKRDIDAKMEPKEPGTILEQRAKKLKDMAVGQNTSEKAEQVGGIAQLQQQKQQQNMQSMTQGAPQGPQMAPQAPPQMAASGGIIMQGAPNMQRMAGGGIIGFASRGEVKAADMAQFEDDFGPAPVSAVISQAEIDAYRAKLPSHRQPIDVTPDAEIVRQIKNPVSLFPKGRAGPPMLDRAARAERDYQVSETERKAGAGFDSMLATHRAGLPTLPANVNNFGSPPPTLSNQPMNTGAKVGADPMNTPPSNMGGAALRPAPRAGIGGVNIPTTQGPATGGLTADDPRIRGLQNALATRQAASNKGLLAEKAGRVGGATRARDDAANFSNRGGVQEQYAAMLARRQALAEEQAAGRADSSFLRRTSGMVPMGNPGQSYGASAVRDMDETDRLARNALTRQEAIRTGGIAADEKIAGKALDVQRTTTASNAQLDAAVTRALQQSMTDQGVALNADQKRALEAQKASMNSADKRALIKSNENIAQYNAKTKEIIQNSVNDVTMESARLTAKARAAQTDNDKTKVIADITKKMADILAKRPGQLADLAAANSVLTAGMKPKAKAAYLAKMVENLNTQMVLATESLKALKARLESGVTRVSGSGTKKSDVKGKQTN